LVVEVVAGGGRERTFLAEPRHRAVHDRRRNRPDVVVTDAEARGHAGPVPLDEHVGVPREVECASAVVIVLEVEHDAALVRVQAGEQLRIPAHRIASRWLDLDHVGAEVGEQLRRVRARAPHAEVQDPHAVEQATVAGGHRSFSVTPAASKVAISCSTPSARHAPEPSPSRRPRSSTGSSPRCSSTTDAPGSVDRCPAITYGSTAGQSWAAASSAAPAMTPSMTTGTRAAAPPTMKPASAASSRPPTSASTRLAPCFLMTSPPPARVR